MFRIKVGCQTLTVDQSNIDFLLREIKMEPAPEVLTKLIVPIKNLKNKTSTSNKLKDTAGDWLISSTNKAFHTSTHKIEEVLVKERNKKFTKNTSYNKGRCPLCYEGYDLSWEAVERIKGILEKMNSYLIELP